jgi:soluble lytic murein transglycosylase-like protein
MQIMPETASFITGAHGLRGELDDPAFNLALGQRYIVYLARPELTGGDIVRLLASYNADPVRPRDGPRPTVIRCYLWRRFPSMRRAPMCREC